MIEKNIFQSWYTIKLHPKIQNKIDHFKSINPTYRYFLYTDADMDLFVNTIYKGEIADCYNKLNIIVAKVDFWRYLVLYHYGGIYLDMDSMIERPLDELIQESDEAIITAENNPNMYVQWALIFSKKHPILKKTIELVVDNIMKNSYPDDIHKMTGPTVYSNAITSIHNEYFKEENKNIYHNQINKNTDKTFLYKNIMSYRLYSIDYGTFFQFKHDASHYLYKNKKHWRIEQFEKPLLIAV